MALQMGRTSMIGNGCEHLSIAFQSHTSPIFYIVTKSPDH